jgi:hypothetical protein
MRPKPNLHQLELDHVQDAATIENLLRRKAGWCQWSTQWKGCLWATFWLALIGVACYFLLVTAKPPPFKNTKVVRSDESLDTAIELTATTSIPASDRPLNAIPSPAHSPGVVSSSSATSTATLNRCALPQ